MPVKKLSLADMERLKYDLACSPKSQSELAAELGVSNSAVTKFKHRYQQEIDEIARQELVKYTGEKVQMKEWRFRIYEEQIEFLRQSKSIEGKKALFQALHQLSEETGQLPPRMMTGVIAVEHVVKGIDMSDAFPALQQPAAIENVVEGEVIEA